MTRQVNFSVDDRVVRGTRIDRLRARERQRWLDLGYEPFEANYRVQHSIENRVLLAREANATLAEIADHMGVTPERIRQMEWKAKRRRAHARMLATWRAAGLWESAPDIAPSTRESIVGFFNGTMQKRLYDPT
jgi:DNA-directed RNA polymerase sigma subunit (sigma70/sigma32)